DERASHLRPPEGPGRSASGRVRGAALGDVRGRLLGLDLKRPRPEGELAAVEPAVEGQRVTAQGVALEVVLGDAVHVDLPDRVRRVHEGAPAAGDDVLDRPPVDGNRVALVVVDVASDRGDVVVLGTANDVVDREVSVSDVAR